jgi:hypothetical protein
MIQLQGGASKEWKNRSYRERVNIPLTLTNSPTVRSNSSNAAATPRACICSAAHDMKVKLAPWPPNLVWRYTDGTSATTPIRFNVHMRDWIRDAFEQPDRLPYPHTKVIWTIPIPASRSRVAPLPFEPGESRAAKDRPAT